MNVRRYALLFLLTAVLCDPIFANAELQSILGHLSDDSIDTLSSGKLLVRNSEHEHSLALMPPETLVYGRMDQSLIDEQAFFVECLSLVPYPEQIGELPDDELLLHLFNTIRSVSTQEGITYISHRKGNKPATLISESYVAKRVGSRSSLPDPVVERLPAKDTMIVFQDDTSFRKNFYQYDYTTNDQEILVEISNRTKMKVFGLIPAIRQDILTLVFEVIPTDEGILLYSMAYAPDLHYEINILGFKVHLPSAFQRRLVAVQDWFIDQL